MKTSQEITMEDIAQEEEYQNVIKLRVDGAANSVNTLADPQS